MAFLSNVASKIWRAKARSYGLFMGACVITGIACGPPETLPGMMRVVLGSTMVYSLTCIAASRRCRILPSARFLYEPVSLDRMVWSFGRRTLFTSIV